MHTELDYFQASSNSAIHKDNKCPLSFQKVAFFNAKKLQNSQRVFCCFASFLGGLTGWCSVEACRRNASVRLWVPRNPTLPGLVRHSPGRHCLPCQLGSAFGSLAATSILWEEMLETSVCCCRQVPLKLRKVYKCYPQRKTTAQA